MPYIAVKKGDSQALMEIDLMEDGEPCDLTNVSTVKMVFSDVKKKLATVIGSPVDGMIGYLLSTEDLAVAGFFRLEVEVTFDDESVATFPSNEYILLDVVPDIG